MDNFRWDDFKFFRFLFSFFCCLSKNAVHELTAATLKLSCCYWYYPSDLSSGFSSSENNVGLTIHSPPPLAPQGYFRHQIRGYMWGCFKKAAYKWELESFTLLFVKLRSLRSSQLVTDTVQFAVADNSLS